MFEFFRSLNEIFFYAVAGVCLGITSFISIQIGMALNKFKTKKALNDMGSDNHDTQRKLKKLWDQEVSELKDKNQDLDNQVKYLTTKLEDYRMKISGMGLLNFAGDKKRADILYSLLMENEALEQMLFDQSKKIADEKQEHLSEKLRDTRKRQRLISEVFNDEKFKGYIQDILNEEKGSDGNNASMGYSRPLNSNPEQLEEQKQNQLKYDEKE